MNDDINKFNKEYFGTDNRKTYLKDNFTNVVFGLIQLNIVRNVLKQVSEVTSKSAKYKLDVLSRITRVHQNGFMLDVRQLLKNDETGSGGKFIIDLIKLNCSQFEDISVVYGLIQKARQFQSKEYYEKIILKYQAQEFHKDRQPDKYCIKEKTEKLGSLKITNRIKRKRYGVELNLLVPCLEEFSEIVMLYQKLTRINTSFDIANIPLANYIEGTSSLFSEKMPEDFRQVVLDSVIKRLPNSIKLVGFRNKMP